MTPRPKPLTPAELIALERIVDRTSLPDLLNALAAIADAKAQHVMDAWQDGQLANDWADGSIALSKLATKLARTL